MLAAANTAQGAPLLVTVAQLRDALTSSPRPVIVDGCPLHIHAQARIPGSLSLHALPAQASVKGGGRLMLPREAVDDLFLGRLGVPSRESPLYLYDTGAPDLTASRAAFVLRRYGYSRAAVVDGGLQAWMAARGPVESGAPRQLQAGGGPTRQAAGGGADEPGSLRTLYCAAPAAWSSGRALLATGDDIAEDLRLPPEGRFLQLLDVRSAAEFDGDPDVAAQRGNVRAGHIPGAVNIPHPLLFASDDGDDASHDENDADVADDAGARACFKSPARLRALFAAAGLSPDRPVVTICQAGIRASAAAVALRAAGFPRVAVYDGSMGEWLNEREPVHEAPVETGPPKAAP